MVDVSAARGSVGSVPNVSAGALHAGSLRAWPAAADDGETT
jgi:hypothetical protein